MKDAPPMPASSAPRPQASVLDYAGDTAARRLSAADRFFLSPPTAEAIAAVSAMLVAAWDQRLPNNFTKLTVAIVLATGVLAVWWLARIGAVLGLNLSLKRRPHPLKAAWKRWAAIPFLIVFLYAIRTTNWPGTLTFAFHRPAMQRSADQVLANPAMAATMLKPTLKIGLYEFDWIDVQADGIVRFTARPPGPEYTFWYSSGSSEGTLAPGWSGSAHD